MSVHSLHRDQPGFIGQPTPLPILPMLQVEPTTRCNFKCGFCAGRKMPQGDMDVWLFEQLLKSITGVRHVELQGEGESMLHPDLFRMANLVKSLHPLAKLSFITNGSLLSDDCAARLVEIGFAKIYISIESADDETFQAIRGGSLAKVVNGIETLISARHRLGARQPVVGLAVTVLRQTLESLPNIIRLYRQLGLDGGVSIQFLQRRDSYREHYDEQMLSQLVTAEQRGSFVNAARSDAAISAILATHPKITGFYEDLFANWSPARGCPWLERGLYLAFDGSALGCCFMKNVPRDRFGKLPDVDLSHVLSRRNELQDQLRQGRVPLPCVGCPVAHQAVAASGK